jgi:hypothetical protein
MNKDAIKNIVLNEIKDREIHFGKYFTILDTTCFAENMAK